ncbi:AMP-binding protein [Flagellimonas olearia]|uniref:AMP-binding protein n=1 Tax=Flagellimonas olearia TaxID=552546 RepID=A0A6I1DYA0_9FLAO|nr:AMP-binding protein [Allomuricauda olearia]KAB7530566.1 AMP-binding protein [Allomuricauda olearia]
MGNPIWHNIHPEFKLNGIPYSHAELWEVGYSLVKEGSAFESSMGDFLLDWLSGNPVLEVFTSGSTGTPKKIHLKKEHMVNSAKATGQYFNLNAGHTALLCLPFSGIAGRMMLVRAMVLGWQLDYVEPTSTPLSHTSKPYDFAAMVPLQVQNSLEQLGQVRTLIIGGAPVNAALKKTLDTLGTNCYETYGMTETVTHIAIKAINGPEASDLFKTLPGVNILKDGRECLVIEAPAIAAETIVTNDLVDIVSENTFQWLGRFDSIINSGGVKLVPEQIERKLAHLMNSRFFVAGEPDEKLGQRLVLVVEGKCDATQLLHEIKSLETLQKFEVPKVIYCVPKFMETKTGKILRSETQELTYTA